MIKTVTFYGSSHIYVASSFGVSCNQNVSFYVLQNNPSQIIKYNQNWNYITYTSSLAPSKYLLIITDHEKKIILGHFLRGFKA